jgi:DNA replication protein DnaC
VVLTEYSILQDVIRTDVLVLDDLGAEKSSDWTLSMLYHVINERYNERRTTIITSNLPWNTDTSSQNGKSRTQPEQEARDVMKTPTLYARISERTYSRITEMCPIKLELQGMDYRRIRGSR